MSEGFGAAARDYADLVWQECRRKRQYQTMKHAQDVALAAYWRRGQELYPYRCRFCNLFHVGHRKREDSIYPEDCTKGQ